MTRHPARYGQPLTVGEITALRLAASGHTSRRIAELMGATTEQGVHLRLKSAAAKLGGRSRTHTVVIALRLGIIRFNELDLPGQRRPPL